MNEAAESSPTVGLGELFILFLIIGAISFGGGVVAYMREYFVRNKQWMDDDDFLDALEVSETLPGLNSINMSVIVGDRLRGIPGATLATLGMLLPGTVVVMTLGLFYLAHRQNPYLNHFLTGVAAAAVGLLLAVTIQLGRKQLIHIRDLLLVGGTVAAVSLARVQLWLVLLVAIPIAIVLYRPRRQPKITTRPWRELGKLHRHD
ncbi:MAG TPA: chromate transporter [Candidatus Binataceae bacterium]|nr:chromate transporter [Candidatus Binataceae bacterium]